MKVSAGDVLLAINAVSKKRAGNRSGRFNKARKKREVGVDLLNGTSRPPAAKTRPSVGRVLRRLAATMKLCETESSGSKAHRLHRHSRPHQAA